MENPKIFDWVWLVIFIVVSVTNGWVLGILNSTIPVVFIFAAFPLIYLAYRLIENPWFFRFSLLMPWLLIAFTIGNFQLPELKNYSISLYILVLINIFSLAVVLLNVFSKTGYFLIVIFAIANIILFKLMGWDGSLRLIWYCNFMLSACNAGMRLCQYFQSFPKGMLSLSIAGLFGVVLGWLLSSNQIIIP